MDEYWSEEPNRTRPQGITYERIELLLDMDHKLRRQELYEMGTAVALAFNDPQGLEVYSPKRVTVIDLDSLPAMLRPVRKKT